MVGALDLASRHTKLATTRGLPFIPALALSSNLSLCARAHVLEYVPHALQPLELNYLRNLELYV